MAVSLLSKDYYKMVRDLNLDWMVWVSGTNFLLKHKLQRACRQLARSHRLLLNQQGKNTDFVDETYSMFEIYIDIDQTTGRLVYSDDRLREFMKYLLNFEDFVVELIEGFSELNKQCLSALKDFLFLVIHENLTEEEKKTKRIRIDIFVKDVKRLIERCEENMEILNELQNQRNDLQVGLIFKNPMFTSYNLG